jgi:deoxyribose-phosphate aldolase
LTLEKPLNQYIEHTLLNPAATHDEFESFLDDAVKYQFAAVCVPPYMSGPVKAALQGESIKVCTVVGFPHGTLPVELKLREVRYHADRGVDEIDFVINYGDLKSERFEAVGYELEQIDRACKEWGLVSKCIVETCQLTPEERNFMLNAINDYTEIDYIKTSTGFGGAGALLGDVLNWNARLQKKKETVAELASFSFTPLTTAPSSAARLSPLKIKAAGGIKDLETALKFIAAGADRLGMSASVEIMEEHAAKESTFAEGEGTS